MVSHVLACTRLLEFDYTLARKIFKGSHLLFIFVQWSYGELHHKASQLTTSYERKSLTDWFFENYVSFYSNDYQEKPMFNFTIIYHPFSRIPLIASFWWIIWNQKQSVSQIQIEKFICVKMWRTSDSRLLGTHILILLIGDFLVVLK